MRTELAVLAGVVSNAEDPNCAPARELVASMSSLLNEFMEAHYGDGEAKED